MSLEQINFAVIFIVFGRAQITHDIYSQPYHHSMAKGT